MKFIFYGIVISIISFQILNYCYCLDNLPKVKNDEIGFELCDKIGNSLLKPYCLNNGVCYKTRSKIKLPNDGMFCSCIGEYTGLRCEIKMDDQENLKSNKEVGKSNFEAAVIKPADYRNRNLVTVKNKNLNTSSTVNYHLVKCPEWYTCLNGGTCIVDLIIGPKCLCTEQFEGLNCGKAKYCPNMKECTRTCDFGYKRKFGCEICECKCINEYNFYTEMKYEIINNTQNMTTKFCNKICPYGYEKDDYDCYKCSCIKESTTANKIEILNEGVVTINTNREISCPNDFCADGEICRYFNSTLFKCPEDQTECQRYEDQEFIPICFPPNLNEICIEPLSVGNCKASITRYYFDLAEKSCKKFQYSGCGANLNNFESFHDCSQQCGQVYSDTVDNDSEEHTDEEYNYETDADENDSESNTFEEEASDAMTTTDEISNDELEVTPDSIVYEGPESTTVDLESTDELIVSTKENAASKQAYACEWVCGISCPFGYKMDMKTKCYKCECVELNMTKCGVPCYLTGTKTCLFSNRANSRPACVCNEGFDGVYCQSMTLHFNFSVRIDRLSLQLNENLIRELKVNTSSQLIEKFDISLKQLSIQSIKNDYLNSVIIEFSIYGPDFSNVTYFYSMIDVIFNKLNSRKVTINYLNQDIALILNCHKTEEIFAMDLEDKYFASIEKLKQFFSDLKTEIITSYRFKSEAIKSLKLVIEPRSAIEFTLTNFDLDTEFCAKTYILNNDIRLKNFILLTKLDPNAYDVNGDDKWSANFWNSVENQHVLTGQNSEGFFSQNAAWLTNTVIYIIVIVSCSVILILVITVLVASSLKRKRVQRISKLNESTNTSNIGRPDKKARDFVGYFLSNQSQRSRCRSSVLSDDISSLSSTSGHKIASY